ncbi:winged helix-turn-helix domain-containing protein [Cryptosporangium sp. NPDC048952]|uniref:winged helix-turn-helix domain-containing protein n=1 Tax=Cryptosporangium sp. NPDC048952 TaxID=3363961 RepID=UPI003718ACE0
MELTDPRAIRALTHPLRLDLLETLAAHGPSTAAECGRYLDTPQANCSFHLRQLAKYGFIEDGGPGDDKRQRRWRLPDAAPTIRVGSEHDPVVRHELERLVVEREMRSILDATDTAYGGPVSALAVVTPEEAAELRRAWLDLLAPYLARKAAGPEQRHVRFFLAATPLPDPAVEGESDD